MIEICDLGLSGHFENVKTFEGDCSFHSLDQSDLSGIQSTEDRIVAQRSNPCIAGVMEDRTSANAPINPTTVDRAMKMSRVIPTDAGAGR
jgi:hypothetical protein